MAITEMSLPIDIPWQRIGFSNDMVAPVVGTLSSINRWRSSLALFYHEPDPADLPPEYCNRRITYLRIVATITSYQAGGNDASVLKEMENNHSSFWAAKHFEEHVVAAYPCFGALLHVGVFPTIAGVPLHDYPYISAFQPRKREMYETVSQSGEKVSQSATNVNITKGATNTDTTEEYDIKSLKGNDGPNLGILGEWGGRADTGQWGTVDRKERVNQNVTTTDASRDKREAYSYSTNINQIYSLLEGYHLGTNRALFFMQPRPHIQDMKFSFIRGLRRLEGLQEFFLIINRPMSLPGLCFEVALETAHAHMFRSYYPRLIPNSDLFADNNLNKTAFARGIDTSVYPTSMWLQMVRSWNSTPGYVRATATSNREGWIHSIYPPEVLYLLGIGTMTYRQWDDVLRVVEILPEIGTEDIAVIFEETEYFSGDFFVTGRRLASCFRSSLLASASVVADASNTSIDGVTGSAGAVGGIGGGDSDGEGSIDGAVNQPIYGEASARSHSSDYDQEPSIIYETRVTRGPSSFSPYSWNSLDHNLMGEIFREVLVNSISSPDRAPYEKVTFLETEISLRNLSDLLKSLGEAGIQDVSLRDLPELDSLCSNDKGIGLVVKNVLELANLSTEEIARTLGLTTLEARKRRSEILVRALREINPKTIPAKAKIPDPLIRRFDSTFPIDMLRKLEESAGISRKEPNYPKNNKGHLKKLLGKWYRQ